jgi:hypothetical protein
MKTGVLIGALEAVSFEHLLGWLQQLLVSLSSEKSF